MHTEIDRTKIPENRHGEIDAVLRRIEWQTSPDAIEISGELAGGRSASQVLEAVVVRGNQRSRAVIKLGPYRELRGEFEAFRTLLQEPNRFFIPMVAVTPDLNDADGAPESRQAVVYAHATSFVAGTSSQPIETFED